MLAMFADDEQYAYFTVVGEFAVDDISNRLRVAPSTS